MSKKLGSNSNGTQLLKPNSKTQTKNKVEVKK